MSEQQAVVYREAAGQLEHAMSVENVMAQVRAIQDLMKKAMKPGEHYGIIPGTSRKDKDGNELAKPSLLKPGAEKIGLMFRLAPSYTGQDCPVEHPGGHLEYRLTCTLTHIRTGEVWGQGVGSCSTMETKYRFRNQKTDTGLPIPADAKENKGHYRAQGFVMAKDEAGGWYWAKLERVEHDNPADYYNTVLKIAKKRAQVDATLTATAASDFFTQDLEDMAENGLINAEEKSAQPKREQPKAAPQAEAAPPAGESYVQKLKDAIGGDVEILADLTKFFSKRDQKEVQGCRDWGKLSETRAKIAYETWKQKHYGEEQQPEPEPPPAEESGDMMSMDEMNDRLNRSRRRL